MNQHTTPDYPEFDADQLEAAMIACGFTQPNDDRKAAPQACARAAGADPRNTARAVNQRTAGLSPATCIKLAAVLPGTDFAAAWAPFVPVPQEEEQALSGAAATDREAGLQPPPSGHLLLTLDELHPAPFNPRKHFEEDALRELAEAIESHGLLQNLVARPRPDGGYEILAGERRWRACRWLDSEGAWPPEAHAYGDRVPVAIIEADDTQARYIALLENMRRRDLTPLEEAAAFLDQRARGESVVDIARQLGVTRRMVEQRLTLNSLIEPLKDDLREGRLTIEIARAVATLPAERQQAAADKARAEAEAERAAKAAAREAQQRDPNQLDAFPDTAPPAAAAPADQPDDDSDDEATEWDGLKPGEANEHGVIRPTETVTLWDRGTPTNRDYVQVDLARNAAGNWQFATAFKIGFRGRSGPIRATSQSWQSRAGAMEAARDELAGHLRKLRDNMVGTTDHERAGARLALLQMGYEDTAAAEAAAASKAPEPSAEEREEEARAQAAAEQRKQAGDAFLGELRGAVTADPAIAARLMILMALADQPFAAAEEFAPYAPHGYGVLAALEPAIGATVLAETVDGVTAWRDYDDPEFIADLWRRVLAMTDAEALAAFAILIAHQFNGNCLTRAGGFEAEGTYKRQIGWLADHVGIDVPDHLKPADEQEA